MNVDQMARNAARETAEAARSMPVTDIEKLEARRTARLVAPVLTVGIAVVVAIALLSPPSTDVVSPTDPSPPTTVAPSPTTVPPVATTIPQEGSVIDADWVRGSWSRIIDDEGNVLHEFTPTVLYGRTTAWDGDDGFVALTESGLVWMRPGGDETVEAPFGSIVDAVTTESGTHVVGVKAYEDEAVRWIELESGSEVAAPTQTRTLDGIKFTIGDRAVEIELPDWTDAETDEIGRPIPPFDLPMLVVSEDGAEVFRIPVGSEQRPLVNVHDFDGRRLIIGAEPFEPALPPVTVWIIDLECPDCTQRVETDSLEYFDLIGILPSRGEMMTPVLP